MSDILIAILAIIFVLGVAINIHEFGHFMIAKFFGMRVEAYSFFGLGPRVWGIKIGHTDYRISAIPLGAYVKLYGDEATSSLEGGSSEAPKFEPIAAKFAIIEETPPMEMEPVPDSELYELRPRWQKFLVMLGGPFMNIVLALASGAQKCAWISSVNYKPIRNSRGMKTIVGEAKDHPIELLITRGNEKKEIVTHAVQKDNDWRIGIAFGPTLLERREPVGI